MPLRPDDIVNNDGDSELERAQGDIPDFGRLR
jgi:hypothetical protein